MPDTLSREEIAEIREAMEGEAHPLAEPVRALLAHIDALTAAVEGLPDMGDNEFGWKTAVLAILRGES